MPEPREGNCSESREPSLKFGYRDKGLGCFFVLVEGILETLAQMDLDLRNLEEMMVDHGYIAEYAGKNDDAEGKETRLEQGESLESVGVKY